MARLEGFIAAGWSPILANITTGANTVVQQVIGWTGGFGTAPSTGLYIGSNGYVANITDGVNIKGASGAGGGGAFSAQGGSSTFNTLNFVNTNGVSFSNSLGSLYASVKTDYQTSGNYLTTAAQSNQVVNSLNGSTGQISLNVGSSLSSSTNGSSITFGLASNITTALQSTGNYLTTAALSTQTLAFSLSGNTATTNSSQILNGGYALAGGNGVTLQQSNNTVSISVATNYQSQGAYLTTAALSTQTLAFSLSGNTATTNSSQILNGGYALAGGNGVTLQQSNNTISISVATNYQSQGAYLTTADLSQNSSKYIQNWKLTGNTSGTTSSAQGTDFWFSGDNGVTISGNNNTLAFSVATNYQSQGAYLTTARASTDAIGLNTAKTNVTWTVNSGGISLNASGYAGTGTTFAGTNVSGSITQDSNGINLAINVPDITLYSYAAIPIVATSTIGSITFGTNTSGIAYFVPFQLNEYVAAGWANIAFSVNQFNGQVTNAWSNTQGYTFGLYTRGTGANSSTLSNIKSFTWSFGISQSSSSFTVNIPTSTNTAGWTYSTISSTGTSSNNGGYSSFTGAKMLLIPINSTLSPGNYWFAIIKTDSFANSVIGLVSNALVGNSYVYTNFAPFGQLSSAFSTGTAFWAQSGGNFDRLGLGSFTTANQSNLPATVAVSLISGGVSVMPWLNLFSTQ